MKFLKNIFHKEQPILLPTTFEPYTMYPEGNIRYITEFKNGYALAIMKNATTICMLDTRYNVSLHTPYTVIEREDINGYRIALNHNYPPSSMYVILDKELKEVPNLQYSEITRHNGYFKVDEYEINDNEKLVNHKFGLLNEFLELILPPKYKSIQNIGKDSFFCTAYDRNHIIFNGVSRKEIDATTFLAINNQNSYGWYMFQNSDKLFGYLDSNFDIIIEPKYNILADEFDQNGYMPFSRDNIIGVIDTSGKELVR